MNERRVISNRIILAEVCRILSEGKRVKLRPKGESMRPFIQGVEDVVEIEPPGRIRRYDVVIARIPEQGFVIHRVVGISEERVILAGDGNLYRREVCRRDDIAGVVRSLIRADREISLTGFKSRLCAKVWLSLLPFRRMWFRTKRRLIMVERKWIRLRD